MDDTTYHRLADQTLAHLADALEAAYDDGKLEDLELEGSVLTIITAAERTLVVSKHAPSQQIWLASRQSGGLHFSAGENGGWQLSDGRTLDAVLAHELAHDGIAVTL